ncbi:hypothetical protein FOA52_014952 [Chlamydomonas sp. UWO 241]|nr:hypothetical protein FOA52_014952 [Chlamydomonas sp. UWO 241]
MAASLINKQSTVVSSRASARPSARVTPVASLSAAAPKPVVARVTRAEPAQVQRRTAVRVMATAAPVAPARVDGLQAPHGGKLVNLQVPKSEWDALAKSATKTMEATDRNACDIELLSVGGFSPLAGFMSKADYDGVVLDMRLENNLLFGIPVVLDTDREDIVVGDKVFVTYKGQNIALVSVLVTYKGQNIALVTVDCKYTPNKPVECNNVYGTASLEHPAVQMVAMERGKFYMGGKVQGLEIPTRVFPCQTPTEVRANLPKDTDILAFQCRNPIHRAHYELFIRALEAPNVGKDAVCLVHPTCGPTQDDDIPGVVRYHTYEVLAAEVANPSLRWAYLPYSMHMAGPREAIQHMIIRKNYATWVPPEGGCASGLPYWMHMAGPREAIQHVIIRKNYGCTHFIIGRDMAGCKSSISGEDFYGAYDAQELATANAPELGMQTVPSLNIAYTKEQGYVTADIAERDNLTKMNLSGTKFRQMLRAGDDIPEWFAFKSVVKVLREEGAKAN